MRPIVRERILSKHENKCCYCESTENLEIDHIIPLAAGGLEDEKNMQVLCRPCNRKKGKTFNWDNFFKKGDGEEYILINNEVGKYLSCLKDHEFQAMIEHYFDLYCQKR